MGKIISFFALFLFLASCSKEENFKKETELSKKEQIVDILVSNGIEQKDISFVNFKENDNVLTFATIEEFKEFVQEGKMVAKLKTDTSVGASDVYKRAYYDYNPHSRWYDMSCSGEIHRLLTLHVSGKYRFVDKSQNFKVIEDSKLSSYLSGLTLGISYNHKYGNIFYDNYYTSQIRFKGEGIINYNLFIEGVGTIYSSLVQFSGYIREKGGVAKLDETYLPY